MAGAIERICYLFSPFERLLLLHFISDNCYVVLRHFYHPVYFGTWLLRGRRILRTLE